MFLRKKVKHQQQNVATSEKVTTAKPTNESFFVKSTPLFARFATTNTTNVDVLNGPATSKSVVSGPMSLGMRRDPIPNSAGSKVGSEKDGHQRVVGGQHGKPWIASDRVDKPLPPTSPSEEVKPALDHRVPTSGPGSIDPSHIGRKTSTQKTRAADVADRAENTEPQSHLSSRPSSTTTRKSSIQDLHRVDPNSRSARAGASYDAFSDSANPVRNNLASQQTHPTYGLISSADLGPGPSRQPLRTSGVWLRVFKPRGSIEHRRQLHSR
ncbi:hypothetical protein F5050DRAFT_1453993 [Lentinula boryana]|uniref:Uncharacterized protein n=1 Tax=Lentinula boryana TaxID=40481 RepID=A0ABQ8QFC6_9AGAR|nr:hypothetical protein F5050DRAFT_1453993 [Lentinula boryana]